MLNAVTPNMQVVGMESGRVEVNGRVKSITCWHTGAGTSAGAWTAAVVFAEQPSMCVCPDTRASCCEVEQALEKCHPLLLLKKNPKQMNCLEMSVFLSYTNNCMKAVCLPLQHLYSTKFVYKGATYIWPRKRGQFCMLKYFLSGQCAGRRRAGVCFPWASQLCCCSWPASRHCAPGSKTWNTKWQMWLEYLHLGII